MLTLIRTQTRSEIVKHSLEALLGQVSSEVWLGEITVRNFILLEKMLKTDMTSKSFICKLGRTLNISRFYSIGINCRNEVSFFEIYKNKSLLIKEG